MSSYKAPRPTPVDHFRTATSDLQEETEEVIHSTGLRSNGPPLLRKNEHLQFLLRNLRQGFPARYVHYDASQPWLLFWTLQGFSVLQVGMDPVTKQRCVQPLSLVCVRARAPVGGQLELERACVQGGRHHHGVAAPRGRVRRRSGAGGAPAAHLRVRLRPRHRRSPRARRRLGSDRSVGPRPAVPLRAVAEPGSPSQAKRSTAGSSPSSSRTAPSSSATTARSTLGACARPSRYILAPSHLRTHAAEAYTACSSSPAS